MCLSISVLTKIKVNPSTKQLVDDAGNLRILHGVNVAFKVPPYIPPITDRFDFSNSFSDEDGARLKSWGMNVIRLTIYWEAVEPVRGKYDNAYLVKVEEIVKICAKYDIQVILDAHQDIANKKFCGEGIPDWAIKPANVLTKFPSPLVGIKLQYDSDGYPTKESCVANPHVKYYLTYEVEAAFDNLFENWNGIGDAFANMWAQVARKFKNYPNLLGYEIMNEPWIGNLYKKPSILYKENNFMNFYRKVHTAIRAVDDNSIIFYEHPLTDTFIHSVHGSPGGEAYNDRQILSYHVYSSPLGDPKSVLKDDAICSAVFAHFFKLLASENATGFLTEFGAVSGFTKSGNDNMRYVLDVANTKLHSWAYWQYKYYEDYTTAARPSKCEGFFDEQGKVIEDKVKVLSRPYVTSSSLPIKSMKVTLDDRLLVEFTKQANSKPNHIKLYLNEDYHFKKGVDCKIKECPSCQVSKPNANARHYFILDHSKAAVGPLNLECKPKL